MSQNIYDTAAFFASYSALPRSVSGLAGAPEWPRLRSFIPPLTNARVLDLGCGYGWYTRYLRSAGASSVLGIDVSAKMLERAQELTGDEDAGVRYERGDLDDEETRKRLFGGEGEVDLVFSSLAVHYLEGLEEVVWDVFRVLKPGGSFVFSAEHPIFTAPERQGVVEIPVPGKEGEVRRVWPLHDYQKQGLRVSNWLTTEGVRKYHRTVTTYINLLLDAGFELAGFNEWYPTREELESDPWWINEHKNETIKPTFLLVKATKQV
ncbi:putative methyl transferase [Lasiosphaeris hirsuta]|uniref:Methyl transferase n=1 Tax=Lasiosphaeris hirsuta TaxID=260670 RepID=A0AA40AYL0_9PEZI|nr:putative methyl transferase [Lasiosphaeris hirsuta]